ncbi:MAG TPA: L-glutamate gamma-semialdehyde dehydrogenase [Pseudomonadota bacterium]|jgi:1-pyrroline-5-carboxylate dehydrogenase|nr:L-glutamate gamma-semialdehyde dehydrogenase [Pseudomonadota bacterium]HNI58905.1 L-glutamate gamma-semialdehyde dehydrogenase [Pseudomonadota bacterium]HNK44607.1 L-glutamate gamma-semialdehyde dehydrogenase [Pseudomonadota bacterium]HNN51917.1 L-glutamate gamma-semialdehyde dehydrogenase [Pseudomonadota bacterium]HNO69739.1 L-glutamate gamma-semialdehyde dehydrogenase [Pseudomonadota bacterium]
MQDTIARYGEPKNEPVFGYLPGSAERNALKAELAKMGGASVDVPLYIGGERVRTGKTRNIVTPHSHRHSLGVFHQGGSSHVEQAIAQALAAQADWAALPWQQRAAVFLKAADLLSGPWRMRLNAATMLGQSKTCYQAEIDAACELADFFRFNVYFYRRLLEADQPLSPTPTWNQLDLRPLEGFVFAVTPFNFTSIAGNLPTAPALLGNVVLWKPAATSMLSAYYIMELLLEAGLPPGVINLVAGPAAEIGAVALSHPSLAGIHFTGSTGVFQQMWGTVGNNIQRYHTYPRLVGETGGKDFILAHESADEDALVAAIVRGGFEYQGQKCSAASRIYVPRPLWGKIRDKLCAEIESIKVGDPTDFRNFMGAVIDAGAYSSITSYIRAASSIPGARVLCGGESDDSLGYFIRPTLVEAEDPRHKLMCEEIFGPVVTLHVYDDWQEALRLVDTSSPYALTGAVFARSRTVIDQALLRLRHAAGNFYINDKPTGAVVGQQPFGGARGSGTNDKAGSAMNLLRWTSLRAIKENFVPPRDYRYGFLAAE